MDFQKKSDEHDNIVRNKAKLVAQGYTQIGVDIEETFGPVGKLESIRLLLSIACQLDSNYFRWRSRVHF